MLNVVVIENQRELERLVMSFYDNGGEPGNEPPEVKDALDKLAECGPKIREYSATIGGWM